MSDKLKSILPPKRKAAAILSVSFACAFMVFFYTPFDMFLNNPTDFIVSWKYILLPLIILFMLCFLALTVLLLFIWRGKMIEGVVVFALLGVLILFARFALGLFSVLYLYLLAAAAGAMVLWVLMIKVFKSEAIDVVIIALWGVIIAAYVQTLFLNGEMIAIAGVENEYSVLSPGNLLNLLIWAVIILAALCVFVVFKIKKKTIRYEKALVLSLVVISGMQISGLVITAVSTDLPRGYDEGAPVFCRVKRRNRSRALSEAQ